MLAENPFYKPSPVRKPDPEKYCQQCGRLMKRKRRLSGLEAMKEFEKRQFCGLTCKQNWRLQNSPRQTYEKRPRLKVEYPPFPPYEQSVYRKVQRFEARLILRELRRYNGCRQSAANALGMLRTSLCERMKKLGVTFPFKKDFQKQIKENTLP